MRKKILLKNTKFLNVYVSSKLESLLRSQQHFLWDDCCGYILNLQGLLDKDWQYSLLALAAGWHGTGKIVKWIEHDLRVR